MPKYAMVCRFRAVALATLAALFVALPSRVIAAEQAVDLELVMITDASRSIDESEARLQRTGTADAFRSREIINAIRAGALGKIAVAYADFSSHGFNRVVVNWRVISDQKSALQFAGALQAAEFGYGRRTSISHGLEFAAELLATNNFNGTRKVIDVSGDGPNNYGRRVDLVRNELVAKGIVINGLPIMSTDDQFTYQFVPDLDRYFAGCVIGGPGSFVMKAQGFADFARAIRSKLFREIAYVPPAAKQAYAPVEENSLLVRVQAQRPAPRAPARPQARTQTPRYPAYEKGCDVGERMRGYGGFGGFGNSFDRFEPPIIITPGERNP